jgi:uncharacterized protein (TIGR04255 family)
LNSFRRIYPKPPVDEALCEFKFKSSAWDANLLDLFHSKLSAEYSANKEEIQGTVLGAPSGTFRFKNNENTRLVTVSGNLLAVHTVRQYDRWEDFRPRIEAALKAYVEVWKPTQIERLGIRYINKIVVPTQPIILNEYLTCPPQIPSPIEGNLATFLTRNQVVLQNNSNLLITQGSLSANEGGVAFVLDVDAWMGPLPSPPTNVEAILSLIDELKKSETNAFEGSITDKTRDLFK